MKIRDADLASAAVWADTHLVDRSEAERWELLRHVVESERSQSAGLHGRAMEALEAATEPWRGAPADMRQRLTEALRNQLQDEYQAMTRMLRMEAVLKRVAPHITRRRWNKGLDPRTNIERWIHTEQLRSLQIDRSNWLRGRH